MDKIRKAEHIIGSISMLANKLTQFGDEILPDITFKQWFLLIMISKMKTEEKNVNNIAEFVGTSRQNVKKMLTALEMKNYVVVSKSAVDARALKVDLTEKAYLYFKDNASAAEKETGKLFADFSLDEIDGFIGNLEKLLGGLDSYRNGETGNDKDE